MSNDQNTEKKFYKLWKIPIVLIALFAVSVFDLPYGFYTFLRIVVFILSLLFALCYYCCQERLSLFSVISIVIAIFWNPIMPIYLDKETWVCLDIIAAVLEIVMFIFSYKLWRKS